MERNSEGVTMKKITELYVWVTSQPDDAEQEGIFGIVKAGFAVPAVFAFATVPEEVEAIPPAKL